MTKSNKNKKQNNTISPELIRQLLDQAGGQNLFGREGFFQQLKQGLANGMLEGEMEHHLGYEKHDKSAKERGNRRNGHYAKSVITEDETLELQVPRDRNSEFEPRLIKKGVRRFSGFDDKVISLYARGMTMREIQEHLYEIYGTDVSPDLISSVTEKVLDEVNVWQNRPLDEVYPIIFLDCIHVKTRDNHMVANKAVYLALAVNMEGQKEVLGLWISKNEGAKFWLNVLTEIKNRASMGCFCKRNYR